MPNNTAVWLLAPLCRPELSHLRLKLLRKGMVPATSPLNYYPKLSQPFPPYSIFHLPVQEIEMEIGKLSGLA